MNLKKDKFVFLLILIISFAVVNISHAVNTESSLQQPYYDNNGIWKTSHFLSVFTYAASNTTKDSVVLNGTINKNNYPVTVYFEYGTSPNLLEFTETNQKFFNSVNELTEFSDNVIGLLPNTTYYFRAVGKNYTNVMKGKIFPFTTLNAEGVKKTEIVAKKEEPKIEPVAKEVTVDSTKTKKESSFFSKPVLIYGAIILVIIFIIAFIFAKVKSKQKKW